MKILLVRPGNASFLSRLKLVNVEPLELEMLSAAVTADGHHSLIFDGAIERVSFEEVLQGFQPDCLAITGYITHRGIILGYARTAKKINPAVKVIVGGVHAELNYQEFFCSHVDYIVHSGGVKPFQELISSGFNCPDRIRGICFKGGDGQWVSNPKRELDPEDLPFPDRSFFYAHQEEFNYLHLRPCAIIKTSFGCPHHCNYCYCRLLNEGRYTCRKLERVVEEIAGIRCDNIWIVDDIFYQDRQRIIDFVRLINERNIQKNFIVYYRADFIAENEEMMALLKSAGLFMVLVGLEAFDDRQLESYKKGTSAAVNERCLAILKKQGLDCTALFMVDIDASKEDFRILARYVKKYNLKTATAGILTPLPGTPLFEKYRERLTERDPRRWDFMHLVAEPAKMSRWQFYGRFYLFYFRLLLLPSDPGRSKIRYSVFVFRLISGYLKKLF